eukprot:Gb_13942 [translate_table: standard]
MRIEGPRTNYAGHIVVALEVFEVAPSLFMVEARKALGNTLESEAYQSDFPFRDMAFQHPLMAVSRGIKQMIQELGKGYICKISEDHGWQILLPDLQRGQGGNVLEGIKKLLLWPTLQHDFRPALPSGPKPKVSHTQLFKLKNCITSVDG